MLEKPVLVENKYLVAANKPHAKMAQGTSKTHNQTSVTTITTPASMVEVQIKDVLRLKEVKGQLSVG